MTLDELLEKATPLPWPAEIRSAALPAEWEANDVLIRRCVNPIVQVREALRAALPSELSDFCECDNTHESVGTVCRPCYAAQKASAALAAIDGPEKGAPCT